MYEGIRSPTVHTPKSLSDLSVALKRSTNPTIFAGGTYIMSTPGYYPKEGEQDIIYLGGISEINRITRNDRYIEFGAGVTLQRLLTVGKQVLPSLLTEAIESTSTTIVRRQITIGGTLCISHHRLLICAVLAALDAEVEIRSFKGSGTPLARWIPIKDLYKRNGELKLAELSKDKNILSSIRISLGKETFSTFIVADDVMRNREEAVILALRCTYDQSVITSFRMCLVFPTSLFLIPQEISTYINGLPVPLSTSQIERIVSLVTERISANTDSSSPVIQTERARRAIEASLHALNAQGLSER
ncbi:MAG: FAD binding domain-containing protein [Sphaerochaetaceae bacterium]|nr:FAD binding domain-containing protein [Sphaerochaetaceae bacterium]